MRNTVPTRAMDDIRMSRFLFGEIVRQHRVQGLDVANQHVGGLRHPAADRGRDPHQGAVGAIAGNRAAHHRDLGVQLTGDRLALRLIPVEYHLLIAILLDEVAVHLDGRVPAGQRHHEPRRLDRLPAASGQTVPGRMDLGALALRGPVADVEPKGPPGGIRVPSHHVVVDLQQVHDLEIEIVALALLPRGDPRRERVEALADRHRLPGRPELEHRERSEQERGRNDRAGGERHAGRRRAPRASWMSPYTRMRHAKAKRYTTQPANSRKKPAAYSTPNHCSSSPVATTRAELARMVIGIAEATKSTESQPAGSIR